MKFTTNVQVQIDAPSETEAKAIKEKLEKFEFHGDALNVLTKLEKGDLVTKMATQSFIRKKQ